MFFVCVALAGILTIEREAEEEPIEKINHTTNYALAHLKRPGQCLGKGVGVGRKFLHLPVRHGMFLLS